MRSLAPACLIHPCDCPSGACNLSRYPISRTSGEGTTATFIAATCPLCFAGLMTGNLHLGAECLVEDPAMLGRVYAGCPGPLIIGDFAIIRPYSVIYAGTQIGHHFQCGYFCVIRGECRLGDRVTLMSRVTLEGKIDIGSGTKIMAHVYLPSRTSLGSQVFIGPGTTFLNDRYPLRRDAGDSVVQGARVEDNVSIGGGCTIFPTIRIGEGAFIGGGSVVTKDVPAWTLAYGVPARHYEMPEDLRLGNRPELMFPQTDIWGPYTDASWKPGSEEF